MALVVNIELLDSTEAVISAMTIIEVYSGAPNSSAASASSGENSAMTTTLTQPAKNEPSAEMQSAAPARPCCAIGWPSMQITTEVGSPGMFSMIAGGEPAWGAP